MTQFLLLQHGNHIRFMEMGFVEPVTVGYRTKLIKDQETKETQEWVVIKVFDADQYRKLRGLMYFLGNKECEKFLESLFEIEALGTADA